MIAAPKLLLLAPICAMGSAGAWMSSGPLPSAGAPHAISPVAARAWVEAHCGQLASSAARPLHGRLQSEDLLRMSAELDARARTAGPARVCADAERTAQLQQ